MEKLQTCYNQVLNKANLEKVDESKVDDIMTLKDVIPKGYELDHIDPLEDSMAEDFAYKTLVLKRKSLTFNDYLQSFLGIEELGVCDFGEWSIESLFGLLWHIVKDKKGCLSDFAWLVNDIENSIKSSGEMSASESLPGRVYSLLPLQFTKALRNFNKSDSDYD